MKRFAAAVASLLLAVGALPGHARQTATPLFTNPDSSTAGAAAMLTGLARQDALRLARMPSATWFTSGTPAEVEAGVRKLIDRSARSGQMPVIVAYNIPYRDCALYSAGGAADSSAYLAWIRGFAAGIGDRPAIVILEPDGLGVIPWHRMLSGAMEPCQPAGEGESAAERRYDQLRGAVDILSVLPNARVYLDGTASNWLAPGEIAGRLVKANVAKTAGFFLNVSNYEADDRLIPYAGWISDCIALVLHGRLDPRQCPDPSLPKSEASSAVWRSTDRAYDQLFRSTGLKRDAARQKHAVLDTSRNGRGSWPAPAGKFKDAETWCNPPGRGLGRRPTLDTGNRYVDAFLWIKIPGESDGACLRGTAGPADPARGMVAPPAGAWFPEQARELIELAEPPLP